MRSKRGRIQAGSASAWPRCPPKPASGFSCVLPGHPVLWRHAQALSEVLPHELDDWNLVSALLAEQETLRMEARRAAAPKEKTLFDGRMVLIGSPKGFANAPL
jgi:hypothetical protein